MHFNKWSNIPVMNIYWSLVLLKLVICILEYTTCLPSIITYQLVSMSIKSTDPLPIQIHRHSVSSFKFLLLIAFLWSPIKICLTNLCIYLFTWGFYIAFKTVQVISLRVVLRAEETSTYSWSRFCTVNC